MDATLLLLVVLLLFGVRFGAIVKALGTCASSALCWRSTSC
ncbi:hypothetical protein [Halomonas sp. BC04]|nr:hypothetical protein [Halomonas sp. BC04]